LKLRTISAAGAVVNPSVDLSGIGANGSHASVRDLRLSGLPGLQDAAATMAEDGSLACHPCAQVDSRFVLNLLGSASDTAKVTCFNQ
jgi:hypothetical protein